MHHGDPAPSPPTPDSDAPPPSALAQDVDPQIIEALRSKDRIYVLKLGETFESLITERRYVFHRPRAGFALLHPLIVLYTGNAWN